MYGAIFGDLVGFPCENDRLDLTDRSIPLPGTADGGQPRTGKADRKGAGSGQPQAGETFSDKTVLTAAMEEGLLQFEKKLPEILSGKQRAGRNAFEEAYLAELTAALRRFGQAYPLAGYPMDLSIWLFREDARAFDTEDAGAAVRAVPVAWMFQEDLHMMRHLARRQAQLTHRGRASVQAADAVATAVFLAVHGCTKGFISTYMGREFGYVFPDEKEMREEILRAGGSPGPQLCVRAAVTAFLHAGDFEDAVRRAVSYGTGRADTAAVAAAVAEAFFGIPEELIRACGERLPEDIRKTVRMFAGRIAEKKALREKNPAAKAGWESAVQRAFTQHPAAVQGNEPLEQAIGQMCEKRDLQSFGKVLEMLRLRKDQGARVFVPVISVRPAQSLSAGDPAEKPERPRAGAGDSPKAGDASDDFAESPAAGMSGGSRAEASRHALAFQMQAIRTRDGRLWQPAYTSRAELDRASAILAGLKKAEQPAADAGAASESRAGEPASGTGAASESRAGEPASGTGTASESRAGGPVGNTGTASGTGPVPEAAAAGTEDTRGAGAMPGGMVLSYSLDALLRRFLPPRGAENAGSPEGHTERPARNRKEPERNTERPAQNRKEPEGNTERPARNRKEPEGNTEGPAQNRNEPEENAKEPAASVRDLFPPQIRGLVLNPGGKAFFLPRDTVEVLYRRERRAETDTEEQR